MKIPSLAVSAWNAALDVPHDLSLSRANRLREKFPEASPAQLVAVAHKQFTRRVCLESATVGGAAAFPGAGTVVSVGASGVQLLAFVSEAAVHTLTVAHLHGLDLKDPAKRTALVLSALTGEEGANLISAQAGIQAAAWFRTSFLNIRTISAERFNSLMLSWIRKRATSSLVKGTLGRMLPFGIGAAVGWGVGASLASSVIKGVDLALGPAPARFLEGIAVDVDTDEDVIFEERFAHLHLPGVDEHFTQKVSDS